MALDGLPSLLSLFLSLSLDESDSDLEPILGAGFFSSTFTVAFLILSLPLSESELESELESESLSFCSLAIFLALAAGTPSFLRFFLTSSSFLFFFLSWSLELAATCLASSLDTPCSSRVFFSLSASLAAFASDLSLDSFFLSLFSAFFALVSFFSSFFRSLASFFSSFLAFYSSFFCSLASFFLSFPSFLSAFYLAFYSAFFGPAACTSAKKWSRASFKACPSQPCSASAKYKAGSTS
mmetsp:Transcript_190/g.274  ORF Transcript_190/g.274 Transcript_190/m.274 type:complete len:239 (+) Transcript_190:113-829(+)